MLPKFRRHKPEDEQTTKEFFVRLYFPHMTSSDCCTSKKASSNAKVYDETNNMFLFSIFGGRFKHDLNPKYFTIDCGG